MADKVETPVEAIRLEAELMQAWRPVSFRSFNAVLCKLRNDLRRSVEPRSESEPVTLFGSC